MLLRSFRGYAASYEDLLKDPLRMYKWFATPAVQQREASLGRVYAHFDARADARRAAIAAAATAAAAAPGGDATADAMVGRCRLTVSQPELKARLVSALETEIS